MSRVPGFIVRPLNLGDAEAVARIHVDSWRAAYRGLMPADVLDGLSPRNRYLYWKQRFQEGRRALVLESEGRVVGFADYGPARESGTGDEGEIYAIYLDPGTWQKGGGSLLFRESVKILREQGFHHLIVRVLEGNEPAIRFYEKHGLKREGEARTIRVAGLDLPHLIFRGDIED